MSKTFVIITNGNFFASRILSSLLNHYSDQVAVLIVTGDYKGRSGVSALRSLAKVTELPYLSFKIFSIVLLKLAQYVHSSQEYSVEALAKRKNIPIYKRPFIRSPEVLDWLHSMNPDLIISVSCPQLIGEKMLSSSRLGGINIHSSLLPKYAGLAPYYWVLSNGEKYTGITVHHMSLKFDTGNLLVQRRVEVQPKESAFHLFWRLSEIGRSALEEAVTLTLNGWSGHTQDLSVYSYFSHPTPESYRSLRGYGHSLIRLEDMAAVLKSPGISGSELGYVEKMILL